MRASGAAETPRGAGGAPGSRALQAGSEMSVSFATPLAATLVVLVGLVPLGVLLSERRRLHRLCGQLGLRPPQGRHATSVVIALTLLVALLALAAAHPAVATTPTERGRADAEAFFVLDTSRSMAAADASGSPTRLDRAPAGAKQLPARPPGPAGRRRR